MVDTTNTTISDQDTLVAKQEIFDYVKTRLGDGMIEVELDTKQNTARIVNAVSCIGDAACTESLTQTDQINSHTFPVTTEPFRQMTMIVKN